MESKLMFTPVRFRHPSLVHRVENGHAVHLSEGKTRLKNLATGAMIEVTCAEGRLLGLAGSMCSASALTGDFITSRGTVQSGRPGKAERVLIGF